MQQERRPEKIVEAVQEMEKIKQKQQSVRPHRNLDQPDQNLTDTQRDETIQSTISQLQETENRLLEDEERRVGLANIKTIYPLMINKGLVSPSAEVASTELQRGEQEDGE